MTASKGTVLVLGATGRQGGATARHLLEKGWSVRVLVRDPQKPAVQGLREAGVEVVQGDYEDRTSLNAAMMGVYGVFSVQAFLGPSSEGEVRQGKQIADAAKTAAVQHFVYSSVQNAEAFARVGGDNTKWEIEQHIWSIGLPATVIRPCLFMEDTLGSRYGGQDDIFTIAAKPDTPLGLIAVDDIGAFAALAFERPNEFMSRTIEIAGDALTPPQIADALSRATGRTIRFVEMPIETLRQQSVQIARALEYLNEVGYRTDINALREQHPGLMDFDAWLEKQGKRVFAK